LKDTLFIIVFGVLVYLGSSTILGSSALMGSYGVVFSLYNHLYFGYVSYIYLFILILPLYFLYKNPLLNFRSAELTTASFLTLFSFLLGQALLVQNDLRGKFGADFVDFLSPYIGVFGLWIFWFIITFISIMIVLDKSTSEILSLIYSFAGAKTSNLRLKKTKQIELKEEVIKEEELEAPLEEKTETNVELTEEEFEAPLEEKTEANVELTEEEFEAPLEEKTETNVELTEDILEDIETPSYLRKKPEVDPIESEGEEAPIETKETKNLLDIVQEVKEQKGAIIVDELEENTKLLAGMDKGKVEKPKNFKLPSVEFLQKAPKTAKNVDESELDDKIRYLIEKLAHFKIDGDVVRTYAGPVVSTFEFKPAANVKVSKILGLQDDLAMALSAETIRIQAPIPGKDVVGIEIPNETVDTIYLREILDDKLFKDSSSPLTIVLGKDIVGKPFVTDLKKLPHLLIAGTTGSGKSVGINAMILSLLYKNSPDQLRLLMIDPKMLEFSTYNDIPHLLTPVITKPKQAIAALTNMVAEMERRYELMAETRTKNIENYNEKIKKEGGEHFPYIVVIIDELADLMMTSGKDVEFSIARLAQKSRACGIHLIVATQRPSVDVVTGLIKANLPSRVSYRVGQKIDSKIILDQMGAESLLGRGDMLFTPPGTTGLVRLHAPWATEEEIEKIVDFIKAQRAPNYDKSFLVEENELSSSSLNDVSEELDALYEDAKNIVLNDRKTSISYLQRKLQIGYNRSARVIEQLEHEGVLSSPNTKGIREIL
jgi:S-DNA-T family DNA segregation ATPase FtsK/SpoIIIE